MAKQRDRILLTELNRGDVSLFLKVPFPTPLHMPQIFNEFSGCRFSPSIQRQNKAADGSPQRKGKEIPFG